MFPLSFLQVDKVGANDAIKVEVYRCLCNIDSWKFFLFNDIEFVTAGFLVVGLGLVAYKVVDVLNKKVPKIEA